LPYAIYYLSIIAVKLNTDYHRISASIALIPYESLRGVPLPWDKLRDAAISGLRCKNLLPPARCDCFTEFMPVLGIRNDGAWLEISGNQKLNNVRRKSTLGRSRPAPVAASLIAGPSKPFNF
jgi:hypothetical protein